MKTNKLTISAIALTITFAVSAQTSFDAAKLYDEELNGTARYVAMGGAMGALGSDISVISHNPAGIGTYRNSDINFSVSGFGSSVNTDPLASRTHQLTLNGRTYYSHNYKSDFNMALDNFSAVLSGSDAGNTYVNFGFSYRKLQNLDRNLDYVDAFFDADGYEVWREYKDHQRNKTHSFDFNVSLNVSDKIYFGWTLGILATDTWSEGYFYDYYPVGSLPVALDPEQKGKDYTAVDKMNESDGAGWNMSFGTIIRPIPALRLGAAIKTPTYFSQTLEYADYLYAVMGEPKDGDKFQNAVDYKFTAPWSIDLSAGLTFGGNGFSCALGAEYEKHFTQRTSLSIGNTRLESQGPIDYKDYSVLKLGTELNFGNISVRGGYNFRESMFNDESYPFLYDTDFNGWKKDSNGSVSEVGRTDFQIDRPRNAQYFTAGLGYCSAPDRDGTQFYVDLAYIHSIKNSIVNVNEYTEDGDISYNFKTDKVMFTIGWNF